MDFETVKFLRRLFALIFTFVGAAAGYRYYDMIGGVAGALVGYVFGWNAVDLFKGRARK